MRDARDKSRVRKGDSHGNSIVSEEQVREIRANYRKWGKVQEEVAARYGISVINYRNIVYGRTWKHVK